MSKPTTLLALLLLALVGAIAAAPASASVGETIIRDCSTSVTGGLTGSYTKAQLRDARKLVRGDVAEYTGCYDAIEAALRVRPRTPADNSGDGGGGDTGGGSSGGGFDTGGGSSGGGTSDGGLDGGATTGSGSSGGGGATADGAGALSTPAPTTVQPGSNQPVQLAGATITPGFGAADDQRSLPTPLIAFLVLLAAGAVGIAAPTIGRRVLARRRG